MNVKNSRCSFDLDVIVVKDLLNFSPGANLGISARELRMSGAVHVVGRRVDACTRYDDGHGNESKRRFLGVDTSHLFI